MSKGHLFLIPNFINEQESSSVFPAMNTEIIKDIRHFTFEHIKEARRYLVKTGLKALIDQSEFFPLDKNSTPQDIDTIIQLLLQGHDVGMLSDAGVPCVADPGAKLVKAAHHHNVKVRPLVGPSSILLALMGSGLNGQSFAFHGYLDRDPAQRAKTLQKLEQQSKQNGQTQLFMDTPYRNVALFESALKHLNKSSLLSIAKEIGGSEEEIITKTIADWRKVKGLDLHKKLAIFSILAQ